MIKLIFILLVQLPIVLIAKEIHFPSLADKTTSEFLSIVSKEKQIYLFGSGGGMMNDVDLFSLSFIGYQTFTVDEARQFYIELMESYIKLINANVKLRPYLHTYPFDQHGIRLSVAFNDFTTKTWKENAIGFVFQNEKEGIIYYDIYDPEKQKLVTVHEEPYEEALKIVKQQKSLSLP